MIVLRKYNYILLFFHVLPAHARFYLIQRRYILGWKLEVYGNILLEALIIGEFSQYAIYLVYKVPMSCSKYRVSNGSYRSRWMVNHFLYNYYHIFGALMHHSGCTFFFFLSSHIIENMLLVMILIAIRYNKVIIIQNHKEKIGSLCEEYRMDYC